MSAGEADTDALRARKTWRTLEPLHGMIYFVPEAVEAYARLGITGRAGYFASRAAPMGAVTADVVTSTFFNFNPEMVHAAIPASWVTATPAQLVAARFAAVDAAFRRLLGDGVVESEEMRRAAGLARTAAEAACVAGLEGRPLAAAHADVGWPAEPHLQLWHAQSILREYRGDGHIALLVVHGLSGREALVTHAAAGDVPVHRPALVAGMVRRRMGGGGGCIAGAGLARDGHRAPLHRMGRRPAPRDRGRHRSVGGGTLCRPRRGSLRRAARAGAPVEQSPGGAAASLRAWRAIAPGWAWWLLGIAANLFILFKVLILADTRLHHEKC